MLGQFIETHGGDDAFASALGAKVGTVRVWKTRGRIPRAIWPEVIMAFPKVTLDQLRAIEAAASDCVTETCASGLS